MMSTLWGFLLQYLLKLKPLDDFPFQNVIANLCVFVTGVCVCVHPHPLNKDFSQAVIDTFYQYHFPLIFKRW